MNRSLPLTAALLAVIPTAGAVAATGHAPGERHAHSHRPPAHRTWPTNGSVTLRTTDDAGTCAGNRAAAVAADGTTPCPTFSLYYALPAGRPKALVVVFHGHGHNGDQYAASGQLADLAQRFHVLAVAPATAQPASTVPNYRGTFDSVDEEARDAAAAIGWARDNFDTGKRTFLLGVSMGGSGLAYFVDAATRPTGGDPDAAWVQSFHPLPLAGMVDAEGISSLPETWAEASGFDKTSEAEIEAETGGTPQTAASAYRSRSLALLPTSEWQATGLPVVAVVHDVDDGLVPYNQTHEARAAIDAAGIPVQTWDVVFKDSCTQGDQTTGSATITKEIPGFPTDTSEQTLCLAGHASENDAGTPVMQAAVQALGVIVGGDDTPGAHVFNASRPSS